MVYYSIFLESSLFDEKYFFAGDNILGNHLKDARFGTKTVIHTKEEEFIRIYRFLKRRSGIDMSKKKEIIH